MEMYSRRLHARGFTFGYFCMDIELLRVCICHFLAEESVDMIEIEEDWERKNCHRKREIVHSLVTCNSK